MAAMALGCCASAAGAWIHVGRAGGAPIVATATALQPATAGLVLGTSARVGDGHPNAFFAARMEAAALLFASGKAEYLIVSGNRELGGRAAGGYDEPSDMRDALIALGVPPERIYRDYAGFHTLDSVPRAHEVFGQTRVIVVSQRYQTERALFLAAANGLAFQGLEAEDVPLRYAIKTRLREIGSRLAAEYYAFAGSRARYGGPTIRVGVDPPN